MTFLCKILLKRYLAYSNLFEFLSSLIKILILNPRWSKASR